MKFVADEGVDKPIVDQLRSVGFEIIYVAEKFPGISDQEVLQLSHKEDAPLITLDTDFGELVYRLQEATNGVVLLRLAGLSKEEKIRITLSLFENHLNELKGGFTVVTKNTIRIRKL